MEVEDSAAEAIEAVAATRDFRDEGMAAAVVASRDAAMAAVEEDSRGRAEAVVAAVEVEDRAEAVVVAVEVEDRADRRQPCFGFKSLRFLNSNPSW
jgi:hypothetical protein